MTEQTNPAATQDGPEFVISRTFEAPRDLVYKAWTEPERLAEWWGPPGMPVRVAAFDLQPGGTFLYAMKIPDGSEMFGKFVYREVISPERLSFVVSFTDEHGTPKRHPLSPTWPLEMLATVTFSEYEGKTTLISRSTPINANDEERATFAAGFDSMKQGTEGSFNQLAEYLAKNV